MTLGEVIAAEIGARVSPNEDPLITQIGTTAGRFLPNNPNRLGFLFTNLSVNAMYILHRSSVSSTFGIRVPPNGGTAVATHRSDFHLVGYDWFVVATAASSALMTLELVSE